MNKMLRPDEFIPELIEIPDISKPSLEVLSYVLRHREMWPKGFEWKWNDCRTCAMGLANKMWGGKLASFWNPNLSFTKTAQLFDIPTTDSYCLFMQSDGHNAPSPEQVADKIDRYLAA